MDESYLTCLLRAQILGKAGFYAGPTDDALKKQIQAENEVYEDFVKTGVFDRKTSTPNGKGCRNHIITH